jgi:hypothetical protein
MTAYYTVAIRRSRIDGLHAAAIAAGTRKNPFSKKTR